MQKQSNKKREQHLLEALGLGENEAMLYTFMLKHPKSTVQELQQRTPLPRTMLYYVLNNLTRQGLVTPIKQQWRTVFIAEDPEHLYDLLEEKQREFDQKKAEIRSIIPSLRQTYRLSGNRPGTRVFEGLDQYKMALHDIFDAKTPDLYMYIPPNEKGNPGIGLRKEFDELRKNKGIRVRILATTKVSAEQLAKQYKSDPLCAIGILPAGDTAPEVDLRLYAGKLLYTRHEKREPIALLIEDVPLYEMQRALFLALWQTATKIKK